jgi:hypothetical protein
MYIQEIDRSLVILAQVIEISISNCLKKVKKSAILLKFFTALPEQLCRNVDIYDKYFKQPEI